MVDVDVVVCEMRGAWYESGCWSWWSCTRFVVDESRRCLRLLSLMSGSTNNGTRGEPLSLPWPGEVVALGRQLMQYMAVNDSHWSSSYIREYPGVAQ